MPRTTTKHHGCPRGFSRALWDWIPGRLRNLIRSRPEIATRLLQCRHRDWDTGICHFNRSTGRRFAMCNWCLHYLRGLPEFRCKSCDKKRYVHPTKGVPTSRLSVCDACADNSDRIGVSRDTTAPAQTTLRRTQGYLRLPGCTDFKNEGSPRFEVGVPTDPSHGRVVPPFASPWKLRSYRSYPHMHAERIQRMQGHAHPSGTPSASYIRSVEERNEQLQRELDRANQEIRDFWFQAIGAPGGAQM